VIQQWVLVAGSAVRHSEEKRSTNQLQLIQVLLGRGLGVTVIQQWVLVAGSAVRHSEEKRSTNQL
jgi:redox-sensitive bicupin YhaK (pirin superfamily)